MRVKRTATTNEASMSVIAELKARVEEAEDTLRALRGGEVDALVIGDQIYTLESADADSNRFRGEVLAQINDVVIAIDNGHRVTYVNPAAERQYEIRASEALGRRLTELYEHRWIDVSAEVRAMEAIRKHGFWRGENIHVKHSGEAIHVESTVTVLHDRMGERTGLLAVIRDITDRKQVEEALRVAYDSLESRVIERTNELSEAYEALRIEMAERIAAEKQRAELIQKVVTTQEDERRRIARDIHDQLGQRVTGLRLQIASLTSMMGKDTAYKLEQLIETAEQLDQDVSFLAWQLRPASLDDLGLAQALKDFIAEWSRHYNIDGDFSLIGYQRTDLSPEAETHFYRIMQEALNNVVKHAHADRVSVLLKTNGGQVSMIIEDNGAGFDPATQRRHHDNNKGLGLVGMNERALLIGGTIEIESTPGCGTTIFVRSPVWASLSGSGDVESS